MRNYLEIQRLVSAYCTANRFKGTYRYTFHRVAKQVRFPPALACSNSARFGSGLYTSRGRLAPGARIYRQGLAEKAWPREADAAAAVCAAIALF